MSKGICSYQEMTTHLIDEALWLGNLRSFIHDYMMVKFSKNVGKSVEKMIICKEDKEGFTKSKIMLITEFFKYLLSLDSQALKQQTAKFENGSPFVLIEFALQILLIPMVHQLQILVED